MTALLDKKIQELNVAMAMLNAKRYADLEEFQTEVAKLQKQFDWLKARKPENRIYVSSGEGGGSGVVESVVAGAGIDVDAIDPANPNVALDAASIASLALADTAVQPAELTDVSESTFLTVSDETSDLPNSRQLLAGTNVTFDDTVAGERTINSSGGGGGALTFVGSEIVAGAAATSLTISGLDLSTDEHYWVIFDFLGATASTANLELYFNGDTTAGNYERLVVTDGASAAGDNAVIGGIVGANPGRIEGHLELGVSGRACWISQGGRISGAAAGSQASTLIWDTVSNVTSLTFTSAVADHLAIGTRVKVWKIVAS
jgi:hypothetical protein